MAADPLCRHEGLLGQWKLLLRLKRSPTSAVGCPIVEMQPKCVTPPKPLVCGLLTWTPSLGLPFIGSFPLLIVKM